MGLAVVPLASHRLEAVVSVTPFLSKETVFSVGMEVLTQEKSATMQILTVTTGAAAPA